MSYPYYTEFPWAKNWQLYANYLTPEIKEWFYKVYLKGGKSLKVVCGVGPQTLPRLVRGLCDWQAQFDAGWPLPLKLVAVFTEELWTAEGATQVRALSRLHKYLQPYHNVEQGVWDPSAPEVLKLKDEAYSAVQEIQHRYPMLSIPDLSTLDPNSEAALQLIRSSALKRVSQGRRAYDAFISGPNGRWIGRGIRETAGEVATLSKDLSPKGKRSFELKTIELHGKTRYGYGFCWGIHPIHPVGGNEGLSLAQGKDVFDWWVKLKMQEACACLMGLAGEQYDDPKLMAVATQASSLGIDYPVGRRSNEEQHREGLLATQWYGRQVTPLLFGDGTRSLRHLGREIVDRIVVLYHLHHKKD